MLTRGIDQVIWAALTDSTLCERLLNGHRREVLDTFNLAEMERRAVLAVRADTLDAFARALSQPEVLAI